MLKLTKLLLGSLVLLVLFLIIRVQAVTNVELIGRAVLPADTFAPGPTSGQLITDSPNGVKFPFVNQQPVQGFSGVVGSAKPGIYLVMTDNGFGKKANSPDSLLRIYAVEPDFKTGQVFPISFQTGARLKSFTKESFIQLSDPTNKAGIALVADQSLYPNSFNSQNPNGIPVDPTIKAGRLLTGGDFDLESFRIASDGTYWFGEEFGPYLLHTNRNGQLMEAPIFLPNFLKLGNVPIVVSPDHPALTQFPEEKRLATVNLPSSKGFEGMALNTSGTKLYAMLEGSLMPDPQRDRLLIHEFDLQTKQYTGKTFAYRLEKPFAEGYASGDLTAINNGYAIGDLTAINDREFLVIERDNNEGDPNNSAFSKPAQFKRIYKINLRKTDKQGFVQKELLVDLLNIPDPQGIGKDATKNGIFSFPFFTIENVLPVDRTTLLVIDDNNYPFSVARTPGQPDSSEFILIKLAKPLNLATPK